MTSPNSAGHDEDSWPARKTLVEANLYRLEQQIGCDVTFNVIWETQKCSIGAHRYMLETRSPVFGAMLSGSFVENSEVEITDVSYDVFKQFIRYLYTDTLELSGDNIMALMFYAKKYMVDGLDEKCSSFMENHLDASNICTILTQSILFDSQTLQNRAMDIIRNEIMLITKEDFYQLSPEALLLILKEDELQVRSEAHLFHVCVAWSRVQLETTHKSCSDANIRNMLGDCLKEIRYGDMSPEEFATVVGTTDLLTSEEKNAFFCRGLAKTQAGTNLSELGFNLQPRKIISDVTWDLEVSGHGTCHVHSRHKHVQQVSVQVERAVILVGMSFVCPVTSFDKVSISVCTGSGTVLYKPRFLLPDSKLTHFVISEISLQSDVIYEITVHCVISRQHQVTWATTESQQFKCPRAGIDITIVPKICRVGYWRKSQQAVNLITQLMLKKHDLSAAI